MDWQKTMVDLGVAGAALLILYQVAKMFFKYMESRGKGDSKGIDRLCAKLDNLVDSNSAVIQKMSEVMLSNGKDQQQLLRILEGQQMILSDIQQKVTKIDVRTQSCLKEEG